jgi:alkyl sulfatase BDS1-like metallo-beta-lactamase superfamily hydrolase
MNSGQTGPEIANQISLPPVIANSWFNRGYYGTMSFNSRAVYQRYMGWYDANPAHLSVLPPAEEGRRYVTAMGGAAKVKRLAKASAASGDYGWAASLLNNVVMSDAKDQGARDQLAGVYEQLGYQAESAIWRNMYLTAAGELRGVAMTGRGVGGSSDLVVNLPSSMIFDLLAVRLDPTKAGASALSVQFVFPERNERFLVQVGHGVLTAAPAVEGSKADATLTLARPLLMGALLAGQSLGPKVASGEALARLLSWFSPPRADFPIVTR